MHLCDITRRRVLNTGSHRRIAVGNKRMMKAERPELVSLHVGQIFQLQCFQSVGHASLPLTYSASAAKKHSRPKGPSPLEGDSCCCRDVDNDKNPDCRYVSDPIDQCAGKRQAECQSIDGQHTYP